MPDPVTALLAASTAAAGSAVVSFMLGAVEEAPDLVPFINGGAALAAVGALGYIAKRLASGALVAQNTASTQAAIAAQNEHLSRIHDQLSALLADSMRREDRLFTLATAVAQHQSPDAHP